METKKKKWIKSTKKIEKIKILNFYFLHEKFEKSFPHP